MVVAIPGQKNKVCVAGVYAYMYCLVCSKATEECCVLCVHNDIHCMQQVVNTVISVYTMCGGERKSNTREMQHVCHPVQVYYMYRDTTGLSV